MTTPKQSVPAPLKVAVFLKLGAVRLATALIVFLILWGPGWVPVATAAQIAGLLGLVVLGMTGYEVFVSSADRPGTGFVIVTSVLMVVCFAFPLWGTEQLWPTVLSSATTGLLLTLLHRHR